MKEESKTEVCEVPQGELLLRTLAMPADTNANGDIFGGWIMSQMDISAGIISKQIAEGRTATVAVNSMRFISPVKVGDVVCCYGQLLKVGRTSMHIEVEVWINPVLRDDKGECPIYKVTEAVFVFVAIDNNGNKREIPQMPGFSLKA